MVSTCSNKAGLRCSVIGKVVIHHVFSFGAPSLSLMVDLEMLCISEDVRGARVVVLQQQNFGRQSQDGQF